MGLLLYFCSSGLTFVELCFELIPFLAYSAVSAVSVASAIGTAIELHFSQKLFPYNVHCQSVTTGNQSYNLIQQPVSHTTTIKNAMNVDYFLSR